jgi:hypothetical protein
MRRNTNGAAINVDVDDATFAGVLGYTDSQEIVNFAQLTREIISIPLSAYVVRSRTANVLSVSGGLTCTSLDSDVIQALSNCSAVQLDGSESEGSTSARVQLNYGLATGTALFHVFAIKQATLFVSDPTLARIPNALTSDCSAPRFEGARSRLNVTYSDGTTEFSSIEQPTPSTSNPGVVSASKGKIQATAAGSAFLDLASATVPVSEVSITVTTDEANIFALMPVLFDTVSFGSDTSQVNRGDSALVEVNLTYALRSIGDRVSFLVDAVMRDGARTAITDDPGLVVTSLNENVVIVSNRTIEAVGAGSGDFLLFTWTDTCTGNVIATSTFGVSVSLNENAPAFEQSTYNFAFDEHPSRTEVIGVVSAVDPDLERSDPIFFGISRLQMGTSVFSGIETTSVGIDLRSGALSIQPGEPELDRERNGTVAVQIITSNFEEDIVAARNGANLTDLRVTSALVTLTLLDVNDNRPSFSSNVHMRIIPRDDLDLPLYQVLAQDLDEGENGRVEYKLEAFSALVSFFNIDPGNGWLMTNQPSSLLDPLEFQISIAATDFGSPRLSGTGVVNAELYDRLVLVHMDLDLGIDSVRDSLDEIMAVLRREAPSEIRLFAPLEGILPPDAARRRDYQTRVLVMAVKPEYNGTNSEIATAITPPRTRLLDVYAGMAGEELHANLSPLSSRVSNALGYSATFGVYDDTLEDRRSTSTRSRGGDMNVLWSLTVIPVLVALVVFLIYRRYVGSSLLYLIPVLIICDCRHGETEPEESYAVMLNRLSANDRQHVLDPDGPAEFTFSGAEIDPITGNAFFYKTTEEVKTVTAPVEGENGTGFTTKTTRLITDEKHWLIKAEPEEQGIDDAWATSDILEAEFGALDADTTVDPFLVDDFANPGLGLDDLELEFAERDAMEGRDDEFSSLDDFAGLDVPAAPVVARYAPNSYVGEQYPARYDPAPQEGSALATDEAVFVEFQSYLLRRF